MVKYDPNYQSTYRIVTCSDCEGAKGKDVIIRKPVPHKEWEPCSTCGGNGEICQQSQRVTHRYATADEILHKQALTMQNLIKQLSAYYALQVRPPEDVINQINPAIVECLGFDLKQEGGIVPVEEPYIEWSRDTSLSPKKLRAIQAGISS